MIHYDDVQFLYHPAKVKFSLEEILHKRILSEGFVFLLIGVHPVKELVFVSIVMQFVGISSARVNVTGQNLLSLYNPYPDNFIDPMMSYGVYPTLRKFTVGLNISF